MGPATSLWAALAGYQAQYGNKSIGEQHPELPQGCVERIDAVVKAAEEMLVAVHDLK